LTPCQEAATLQPIEAFGAYGAPLRIRGFWLLRVHQGRYWAHRKISSPGSFQSCQIRTDTPQKANFLSSVGKKTPVFVRFSTVTFGREFPDEGRNPRGFAIKFYIMEGNYDIVGLNFSVFFCRDPIQGPDVIRSQYRNPKNFLLDYDALSTSWPTRPRQTTPGSYSLATTERPKAGATTTATAAIPSSG